MYGDGTQLNPRATNLDENLNLIVSAIQLNDKNLLGLQKQI